jgi:DNA-binding transcriptional ArsR family regulator
MSETERLLNDIRAYLRISAAAALRATAKSVIDTYEKALVYSKLDGKITQIKIEADTEVPQPTISIWLTGLVQAGLVAPPDQYNNSHRALFTLQELGIELGTLKKRAKVSKPIAQPSPATVQQAPTEPQQSVNQKNPGSEKSGATNQ